MQQHQPEASTEHHSEWRSIVSTSMRHDTDDDALALIERDVVDDQVDRMVDTLLDELDTQDEPARDRDVLRGCGKHGDARHLVRVPVPASMCAGQMADALAFLHPTVKPAGGTTDWYLQEDGRAYRSVGWLHMTLDSRLSVWPRTGATERDLAALWAAAYDILRQRPSERDGWTIREDPKTGERYWYTGVFVRAAGDDPTGCRVEDLCRRIATMEHLDRATYEERDWDATYGVTGRSDFTRLLPRTVGEARTLYELSDVVAPQFDDVYIHWTDGLPVCVRALTDGRRRIWMDQTMMWFEARSTLAHELEHIARGHTSAQPASEERRVRAATANRLVPLKALRAALSKHERALADEFDVDVETMRDRLQFLAHRNV